MGYETWKNLPSSSNDVRKKWPKEAGKRSGEAREHHAGPSISLNLVDTFQDDGNLNNPVRPHRSPPDQARHSHLIHSATYVRNRIGLIHIGRRTKRRSSGTTRRK